MLATLGPKQGCHAFSPQHSCLWISLEIRGGPELKDIFPVNGRGRWADGGGGTGKRACFLELLKNKCLEINMCLVESGIAFN